ncbi:MAG: 16S rRNA (guanine(527)-N(7))-methyltransferase RsmG [Vicinamibacterales bacterium]
MASRDFRDRLHRRAFAANVTLDAGLEAALESYYRLLANWNSKINLTSFPLVPDGEDESVDRLLIEPLAAVRHLPGRAQKWLDAGSGGGSPAIPMKLAQPGLRLHMVEAKTRKAAFLREAVRSLGLEHTEVVTSRFEMLLTKPELHEALDVVTIRAVRLGIGTMVTLQAFLKKGGRLMHFCGTDRADIDGVAAAMELLETHPLLRSNQSHLAVFRKVRN